MTPDQLKALNGPCRQLIIGAAGTGKTIVLQAKALELLCQDQSVLVLAAKKYEVRYSDLFSAEGFQNFELRLWDDELFKFSKKMLNWWERCKDDYQKDTITFVYTFVKQNHTSQLKEITKWLQTYDFILIDDARDQASFRFWQTSIVCLAILALASIITPDKTVWISLDFYPHTNQFGRSQFNSTMLEILDFSISPKKTDFVIFLQPYCP